MIDFGVVRPGTTLYIPFATYDSNDPSASVTLTGLAVTDIEIYKDGSVTQRSSDAGYTLLDTDGIDFDAQIGLHGFSINLADNTDAGFYAAGSQYWVWVASVTVDAATVNFIAATFRIGYEDAFLNTTIATLATQTSFTLTAGPAEDDAINGMWCIIHDVASAVQKGIAVVSDYTGSTKTVTLAAGTTFTAAATDNISIMGPSPLQPTTTGNKLDVTATGAAGIDWGNVENKTTANDLSATDIQLCDTTTTATNVTTVNGLAANVITAASIATGAIDADAIAADAIGASELAADAVAEIADAVWDEATAGHAGAGSYGLAVSDILTDTATTLQAEVDGIQADTEDIQTRLPAALSGGRMDSSVGAMAAGTLTASALAADAVDEILDETVGDGTTTMREALRILIAGMAGKLSGAATTTVTIRNLADTADVIVATVDADGNRSAVTVTP